MSELIIIDDALGEPLTDEQRARVRAWWDARPIDLLPYRATRMHDGDLLADFLEDHSRKIAEAFGVPKPFGAR